MPLLAATPLAASPVFHLEVATADTELRAARALLERTAADLWAVAAAGVDERPEDDRDTDRAHARAAAVWAVERATAVVDAAFRAGGSASLYAPSSLQRRLRDIHALGQHFLARRDTLVTAGAFLAGQHPEVMVF
jgi:alkylation response protein AidB-like acyl-CoA dehydrogenase